MRSAARKMTNAPAAPVPAEVQITPQEHKRIARLAYSYWEARGRPDGSSEEDWFRAEAELRRRKSAFTVMKAQRHREPRSRTGSKGWKSAR
jgi:hypothetical protein